MPAINTNTAGNSALRYLNLNNEVQTRYLGQLSSGLRVNRSQDDAASLAIGTKIKSDANTLATTAITASNAQAYLATGDGGLAQISNILQRLKQLTTQAQSGIVTTAGFSAINAEFQALITEINAAANGTRFAGTTVIGTGAANAVFLLGTAATDTITYTATVNTNTTFAIPTTAITTSALAATAATAIDTAIDTVNTNRASLGAVASAVSFRAAVINVSKENADATVSSLLDADVAQSQTDYTNASVLTQSAIAALQKANSVPQQLLRLLQS